ncbi:hypothetical protein GCM10023231_23460 [Olivibacter ginsenosidimutans]|uniref:Helix-turn-helix transcriptional regulator n=1 Tax=Olivibacter ginsenosidimutans TaxID=1176537 RepID=A0ABP9BEM8_9SPHI
MELAEKLRLLRYSYDYSKSYVAYKLGVDVNDYLTMESGELPLSLTQLEALSELYQLKAIELAEDGATNEYTNWQGLVENWDNISEKERCEASIADIKSELADIKEILYTLIEKLGIS